LIKVWHRFVLSGRSNLILPFRVLVQRSLQGRGKDFLSEGKVIKTK
jgi:hypothetical protein